MHDLGFRFKRAHLKAVAFAKPFLRKFGLTPARFDALYVVQANIKRSGSVLQSRVWQVLDLHPSTISRMFGSLEELGLIRRLDAPTRNHEISVQLTAKGAAAMMQAMRFIFNKQAPRFAYRVMLFDVAGRTRRRVDAFISKLRRTTDRAARALGDESTLLYPLLPPSAATLEKVQTRIGEIYAYWADVDDREKKDEERRKQRVAEEDAKEAKILEELLAEADAKDGENGEDGEDGWWAD